MKIISAILVLFLSVTNCADGKVKDLDKSTAPSEAMIQEQGLKKAYFASGCFWCVEAIYEHVEGVTEAISGYSGGNTQNPKYREVGSGETGHAEAVEVIYDPSIVDFKTLLVVYYGSQDPTTVNGQHPDYGSAYRSIIFYSNEEEKKIVEDFKKELGSSGIYDKPIATEILAFEKFWEAEAYHQNYERLNPNQSYVKNVSIPRLNRFKAKHPDLLKK